jgi:hypothetical protein
MSHTSCNPFTFPQSLFRLFSLGGLLAFANGGKAFNKVFPPPEYYGHSSLNDRTSLASSRKQYTLCIIDGLSKIRNWALPFFGRTDVFVT